MRKWFGILAVGALLLAPSAIAGQQTEGVGLGIVVGEPTGVTLMIPGESVQLQFHGAWSFQGSGNFHLSGDMLRYYLMPEAPEIPFYYGVGARAVFADDFVLGVRVPLGITYFFDSEPVGLFLEVVPILDFIPDTEFEVNAGIGARYYFGG
jgi:hypothetical protein